MTPKLLPARKTRWKKEDLLWMAGLLEGEGSFIVRRKKGAAIQCNMTDEDVLLKLAQCAGVGNVTGPYEPSGKSSRRKVWAWGVRRCLEVEALMRALRPYMGRRRQAQIDVALKQLVKKTGGSQ